MENFTTLLFDFLTLVADTYKIYVKNGRLMSFIAALIISLHALLYLFNILYVMPMTTNLIMEQSSKLLLAGARGTPEYNNLLIGLIKGLKIFVGVELILLLISAISYLFLAIFTTYASALIHSGKEIISIKDFVSRRSFNFNSLKSPLITSFYITLFTFGYLTLFLVTLFPFVLILGDYHVIISKVSNIVLAISATVFYSYLSTVWKLSLVVSIIEEGKCGIDALGKAAQIVKGGIKLHGFIINLLSAILGVILSECLTLSIKKTMFSLVVVNKTETVHIVVSLVIISLMCMAIMVHFTAYTVFYYRCKKSHGEEEEVEFQAAITETEYVKLLDASLVNNQNTP